MNTLELECAKKYIEKMDTLERECVNTLERECSGHSRTRVFGGCYEE